MSSSINSVMTSRISGLASGLDTEAIVADLMKASKLKISEVEQKKQILEWKQEFYKEIATSLYNFQNKYFGGATSSLETALKSMKATSSSSLVTVTASSSSPYQNIYIHDIVSLATNTTVVSSTRVSADPKIKILDTENLGELGGKSIVINLDGTERTLTFSEGRTYESAADILDELQALCDRAFGSGRVNISLEGDELKLSAESSTLILKNPNDEGADPSEVLYYDSFASNRVDMNVSLDSAGLAKELQDVETFECEINGKTFIFSKNETLVSIITKINSGGAGVKVNYSQLTDKFTIEATESGASSDITMEDKTGNLLAVLFGEGEKTMGTDAVVKLSVSGSTNPTDFITVTRSTNTINFDGVSITLNGMAEGNTEEKISVSLSRDVDALVEQIKSFIADYNNLLSQITTKLTEEYDRSYLPLTEEQKSAMNEKDIELWNEKAKTGILRNDIYLTNIANQLKSIFYTPVSGLSADSDPVGMLAEVGISTTKYADRGKLTIDEKKLRDALTTNPDKVISLFTQKSPVSYSLYAPQEQQIKRFSQSGVLDRLSDILKTNLNKVGKKGALITLVGSPDDAFTGDTEYSKRINDLKNKIAKMNDKLADEEERYWRQFAAMEKALSNLYAQSSWLASFLDSGNRQ